MAREPHLCVVSQTQQLGYDMALVLDEPADVDSALAKFTKSWNKAQTREDLIGTDRALHSMRSILMAAVVYGVQVDVASLYETISAITDVLYPTHGKPSSSVTQLKAARSPDIAKITASAEEFLRLYGPRDSADCTALLQCVAETNSAAATATPCLASMRIITEADCAHTAKDCCPTHAAAHESCSYLLGALEDITDEGGKGFAAGRSLWYASHSAAPAALKSAHRHVTAVMDSLQYLLEEHGWAEGASGLLTSLSNQISSMTKSLSMVVSPDHRAAVVFATI